MENFLSLKLEQWYPTMTLYRQKTPGNWADVFSTVEQKLLSKLEEGK